MDSHVRWHNSNCVKPRIIVDDGEPRCHSCGGTSSALIERLVSLNQIIGGDISLPVEAPLGEAHLWWPSSVPYRSSQTDMRTNSDPSDDRKEAAKLSGKDSEPSSLSPIYPSSLDSQHFRLVFLPGSNDHSSPIHIELDKYALHDCPEYETVSYVWGGEEGDSTACTPVYVGDFWDVILVTKNCSAVLHYLRPRRGCRFIWLDAICINQADNIEKPAQISRMGDIYANCERVVAFLGEDLISRPQTRMFRQHIDFQWTASDISTDRTDLDSPGKSAQFLMSCARSAGLSNAHLFKRRYLSRIWILQEILLSKKTMLPLGDLEIICDQKEAMHLVLRTSQELISMSDVHGQSLSHLLRATAHCHASDPRDRVYGLLSLFHPQDKSRTLVADYSLSWRDCWVGTAAYILLVERNLVLLANSVGINRPTHMPSWVPDIRNAGSWFLDFDPRVIRKRLSRLAYDDDSRVRMGSSENWATEFVMYSVKVRPASAPASAWDGIERWAQVSRRFVHPEALYTQSIESASIDSSDGALRLRAIRVFDGNLRVRVESENDSLASIWVRGPSTAARFRVLKREGFKLLLENHQVFIISSTDLDSNSNFVRQSTSLNETVLLAFANAVSDRGASVVTIHDCFILYDFHLYSMDCVQSSVAGTNHSVIDKLHSLYWVLRTLCLERLQSCVHLQPSDDWIFPLVFPSSAARTRHLFPFLVNLMDGTGESMFVERRAIFQSMSSTAKSICPDFDPVVRGQYLHLTAKNDRMLSRLLLQPCYGANDAVRNRKTFLKNIRELIISVPMDYNYGIDHNGEEWMRFSLSELRNAHVWNGLWDEKNFPITVRISLDWILYHIKKSRIFEAVRYARGFMEVFNEDAETFLSRKPTFEDFCIFFEPWGPSLVEELRLVWKLESIIIA